MTVALIIPDKFIKMPMSLRLSSKECGSWEVKVGVGESIIGQLVQIQLSRQGERVLFSIEIMYSRCGHLVVNLL